MRYSRYAGFIVALAMSGCVPPMANRERRVLGMPQWLSVRFHTPRDVTSLSNLLGSREDWKTLPNVADVGGQILENHADTLLIKPTYIIFRDSQAGRDVVEVQRSLWTQHLIVLVDTNDPGTVVGVYRYPKSLQERVTEELTHYAIGVYMLVVIGGGLVRGHRW